jgi:hypothetical protein
LTPKKRGRKANPVDPVFQENQRLRRKLERLQNELEKAHTIIEVQKKLSRLLSKPMTLNANETSE